MEIEDKILGQIVGKDKFSKEEYEKLLEKHREELEAKYAELKKQAEQKPEPQPQPKIDINALQSERERLLQDLDILNTSGYQKLLEEREKRAIQARIEQIDKLLQGG